jgi:CheY-like chemotaxis protein/tRNA A-37 threonylcarbamoyl transferase component Bud32
MQIPNLTIIQDLLSLNIIGVHDLEKAFAPIEGTAAPFNPAEIADLLIKSGDLTPFQAQAAREGRAAELVMGNYIVLDKLGSGGMGAVYKARHRRMKREVALKVLKKELVSSADSVLRFQREAESSARCSHPGVVAAYDADEGPLGHFLAMEFVDGTDLAGLVTKRGPLPVAEAIDCTLQAARAMAYVHSRGLVHRDIKPANFLRDNKGVIKVADLGLVRVTECNEGTDGEESENLTQAYTIAGTLEFMAPEQAVDTKTADHRADIYSLGCTLWYLLTAKNVYSAKTQMQKILAHQNSPIPSLCEARPDAPTALDKVFRKMVAKKITERYQTMDEVVVDLEKLVPQASKAPPAPPIDDGAGATMVVSGGISSLAAMDASPETYVGAATTTEPVILLVESSRFQASVIGKQLESAGMGKVAKATNAMMAQEVLEDSRVILVVSSFHLPNGTGVDLLRSMRADVKTRNIPFLLISSAEDSGASAVAGFNLVEVLHKPFTQEQITSTAMKMVPTSSSTVRNADTLTVLLADDSPSARRRIKNILIELGFKNIIEANDGTEAAKHLDEQTFDLICTDFQMPGLTGDLVSAHARRSPTNAKTPILMNTSETEPRTLASARNSGVDVICAKSAPTDEVQTAIRKLARI